MLHIDFLETVIGRLTITASDAGITSLAFTANNKVIPNENAHTDLAKGELMAYFDRELTTFTVPMDLRGYSGFSYRVWMELIKIPYGSTISYKTLAISLGDVKCIRAAATANGRNPIPILVPCHRVIGSDGSLTGYALGLDIKKELLVLENADFNHARQLILSL